MTHYDPDTPPDPTIWLALDPAERRALVERAHVGRFPDPLHRPGTPPTLHAGLHVTIEDQIASGDPPITGGTIDRLGRDGLKRHAALHAVVNVLMEQIVAIRNGEGFDADAWDQRLRALSASEIVARALGAPH